MKVTDGGGLGDPVKEKEEPSHSVVSSRDSPLAEIWGELRNNTSLHGLSRISTEKTVFHGIFWGAMTLFMVTLLIIVFVLFSQDYFSYDTLINIKVTSHSEMTFPSVTICNASPINISSVNQSHALNEYYFAMHMYGRFFDWKFVNLSNPFYSVLAENRTDSWLTQTKFRKSEMIYYSEFGGKVCRDCFDDRLTDIGMCVTFNGPSRNPPFVSQRIGSRSGLTTYVFLDQNNYIYGENLGAGLLVNTHGRDEEPNMADNSFLVSAGTVTYMPFRRTEVTFLPYPYKAFGEDYCTVTTAADFQNPLRHYPQYSVYACMRECRAEYVYRTCNCRHINDYGNETICTIAEEYTCVKIAKETFDSSSSLKNTCNCPRSCHHVLYEPKISSAKIPSTKYEQHFLARNVTDISTNLIELRFFYQSSNVETVRQVPKIDVTSVLGNIGGYLGIFLGASILTLTELLEVFLLVIYLVLKRLLQKVKGNVISSDRIRPISGCDN